jgi:uncharacterized membrane protein YdbT with pleckstrin-like domain
MKETVIWSGRPSWKGYLYPLSFAAFWTVFGFGIGIFAELTERTEVSWIGLAAILGGLYYGITMAYDRFQAKYRITTTRIICEYGILSSVSVEMDIHDIRTINVSRNLMQKVLNLGDMEFATASGPMKDAYLRNIEDPEKLKEIIHAQKNMLPVGA